MKRRTIEEGRGVRGGARSRSCARRGRGIGLAIGLILTLASNWALAGQGDTDIASRCAEKSKSQSRRESAQLSPAACFLSTEERTRLPEVGTVKVARHPVVQDAFAQNFANACQAIQSQESAALLASSASPGGAGGGTPSQMASPDASTSEALQGVRETDPEAAEPATVRQAAADLLEAGSSLSALCTQVGAEIELGPSALQHLRLAFADDGRGLAATADLIETLGEVSVKLAVEDGGSTADAHAFVVGLRGGIVGTPASLAPSGGLGDVAQRVFEGLAEFVINRAKEEALSFVREELQRELCETDAGLFLEETCTRLDELDSDSGLASIGAMVHASALLDLDRLADKLAVLVAARHGEAGYVGTTFRVVLALARGARDKRSPLSFISSLHRAELLTCERLASTSQAITGDRECAATMAVLRLGGALTRAVIRQGDGSQGDAAVRLLGAAFALEQEFAAMPVEVRIRLLALLPELGQSGEAGDPKLVLSPQNLVDFRSLAGRAVAFSLGLKAKSSGIRDREGDASVEEVLSLAADAASAMAEASTLLLTVGLPKAPQSASASSVSASSASASSVLASASPGLRGAGIETGGSSGGEVPAVSIPVLRAVLVDIAQLTEVARAASGGEWAEASLEILAFVRAQLKLHSGDASQLSALARYLPMAVEIANAGSSEEVAAAFESAFPAGGYKLKYRQPTVALNAFLGGYGGVVFPLQGGAGVRGEAAMFAPVGVHVSRPIRPKNGRPWHVGALIGVIDLGAITTSKWLASETKVEGATTTQTEEPADFNLAGLLSPGLYLVFGIAQSPFSVGAGLSVNPFAQRRTVSSAGGGVSREFVPALRAGAFVAVDVTMVAFGLRRAE